MNHPHFDREIQNLECDKVEDRHAVRADFSNPLIQ